jgi:hypothetical protein
VVFSALLESNHTVTLRSGLGSFGENQQGIVGEAVGRKFSEAIAGSQDFSTGFIPDRDYRTEDGSTEKEPNEFGFPSEQDIGKRNAIDLCPVC